MAMARIRAASADISMIRVRNCDTPVIKDEIAELAREPPAGSHADACPAASKAAR